MSQEKMLEAAKEGNPQVIAAMINRSLEAKGISVKVSNNNGCLNIIVEAQEIPKQDIVVDFLRNGISKLKPLGISKVVVQGRALGQEITAWQESFNLRPSTQSSFNQVDSTVTNGSSLMSNHSSNSRILVNNSKTRDNRLDSLSMNQTREGIKTQGLKTFGWILFTVGSGMLLIGLTYDPTVSSGHFGLERTYNIGSISIKSTYTNTGGFLAVCGAIFATCTGSQIASKGDRE